VHLDHGLHPHSSAWAEHCRTLCQALDVPLTVRRLAIARAPGESLEAVAREARYAALAAMLRPGELVLTAQHRDDQAETLLLALLRGSGPEGLAAMPWVCDLGAGRLVRPLLGVSRAALEGYARHLGLSWVEDPSNASHSFDRNFLRHRVLPLVRTHWPEASATLARSAGHCAEAADLIERQAVQVLATSGGTRPGTLSIPALARLDPPLCRAVLRLWLRRRGMPLPDTAHLGRILSEVLPARLDANPLVTWSGCEIRRYRQDLFATTPLPPRPGDQSLEWLEDVLTLPPPLGILTRSPRVPLARDRFVGHLVVRFGIEGQWCRPRPGGHSRPLKKLFQEAAVPPWLRPYVPLVFADGNLVAVAGVCPCLVSWELELSGAGICWSGHPWEELGFFNGDG
jgi:tRNA(Ile)-lysidine synthase